MTNHQLLDSRLLQSLKAKRIVDRVKALESLAESDDRRAIRALIEELSARSPLVRSVAAEQLGRMAKKEAVAPLIKKLADSNSEVRMMAARSLGNLLRGQASPRALLSRLTDADELVRIGLHSP